MSALKFSGYRVVRMSYTRNENYVVTDHPLLLNPVPATDIDVAGDQIKVTLAIVAGALTGKKMPFKVTCVLVGDFTYEPAEGAGTADLDTLVRNNAVAILYPYARAIVATLTNNSGEFPSYNLPTINVSEWLADEEKG
ncbi:protein-export chaperone SecB [Levilactobacillus angrenensis]|uniref:Protein-export chaperone SecB n=1 Tax=Levilactobacillus angrenensis TaxID=2486020 RepID=A0ABW1UC40_9LACO|nr:protein-export chaperone SecB [Levilactobacillus angrenensis]